VEVLRLDDVNQIGCVIPDKYVVRVNIKPQFHPTTSNQIIYANFHTWVRNRAHVGRCRDSDIKLLANNNAPPSENDQKSNDDERKKWIPDEKIDLDSSSESEDSKNDESGTEIKSEKYSTFEAQVTRPKEPTNKWCSCRVICGVIAVVLLVLLLQQGPNVPVQRISTEQSEKSGVSILDPIVEAKSKDSDVHKTTKEVAETAEEVYETAQDVAEMGRWQTDFGGKCGSSSINSSIIQLKGPSRC